MSAFHPINESLEHYKAVVSVRIDNDILEKIDALSGKVNISCNDFINQCIRYSLDNLDTSSEEKTIINRLLS